MSKVSARRSTSHAPSHGIEIVEQVLGQRSVPGIERMIPRPHERLSGPSRIANCPIRRPQLMESLRNFDFRIRCRFFLELRISMA